MDTCIALAVVHDGRGDAYWADAVGREARPAGGAQMVVVVVIICHRAGGRGQVRVCFVVVVFASCARMARRIWMGDEN